MLDVEKLDGDHPQLPRSKTVAIPEGVSSELRALCHEAVREADSPQLVPDQGVWRTGSACQEGRMTHLS